MIKKLNKFFVSLFLVPSFLVVNSCSFNQSYGKFLVEEVIDGDTYKINQSTHRLLGVDTAETYDANNNFQPTTGSQYFYGLQAKKFSQKTILNHYINLDVVKKDKYNRFVSRITIDNDDLSTLLVSNGLAVVRYISTNKKDPFYYPNHQYVNNLWTKQLEAKKNKKGFWKESPNQWQKIFPKYDFKQESSF